MTDQRTARAAFGPQEAAAMAREFATTPTTRPTARRRRFRLLARQAQAAYRAWKLAGRVESS